MATWKYVLVTASLAILLSACGEPPTVNHESIDRFDQVVARADTLYSITFPELYRTIEQTNLLPDGGRLSRDEVAAHIDRILVDTLAGLAADTVALQNRYEYLRIYRNRYYEYLIRRFGQVQFFDKVSADSQEIAAFYEENKNRFVIPERVDVSHILIAAVGLGHNRDSLNYRGLSAEELAAAAEQYAWQVHALLEQGHPFDSIAREFSHDNMLASRGPSLGLVGRGTYEDPFDSVAFNLPPGQFSEPYFSSSGWHIIYVASHNPETIVPLDETVSSQISTQIRSAKSDEAARPFLDSLDQTMRLTINEPFLDTNAHLVEKSQWAAVVNDRDTVDFADLQALEEGFRRRYNVDNTTPDMKREMIRSAARRYLLVQAARAAGIEELPDVRAEEQSLRHQNQKAILLRSAGDSGWMPSDSLLEAYYRENYREEKIDKPLVVQHIVAPDSASAAFIRDQAVSGLDFLELAEEYYPGDPGIRRDLADLGPIGPDDVSREFFEAARITSEGMVSLPVQTQYGWHVIKVLEHRKPLRFDQARMQIQQTLREQHKRKVFESFRDQLYRQFNVSFPNRVHAIDLRPRAERQEAASEE